MSFIWSVLGFVIAMGLLVTIHEWGHYITARLFNIKVVQFSVGFGKAIYAKQRGETEYRLGAIPLGGYVKFVDEREGPVDSKDLERAFNRQSVYKRFAVVAAGPLINLVFAWLIFSSLYLIGTPGIKPVFEKPAEASALEKVIGQNPGSWEVVKINDQSVATWNQVHHQILSLLIDGEQTVQFELKSFNPLVVNHTYQTIQVPLTNLSLNETQKSWFAQLGFVPKMPDISPVLGQIVPDSPAQISGFLSGDKIISVNGLKVESWKKFVEEIQGNPGKMVFIAYERNGAVFESEVLLEENRGKEKPIGRFGASVQYDASGIEPYKTIVQYPFFESWNKGLEHSTDLVVMSLEMLKKMLIGQASIENLSGPITIADFSGQALQSGWVSFLSLIGLLSLSLGILNLLPIPLLDGGHLAFYLIEMVKGSPLNESIEVAAQKVGLFLILGLTFLAIFNDIVRITDG